ncbi:hypothetical protein GCM10025876_22940 [Demequina litorisediminis]|uniref:Uncharacterized protein n=1 Tax=Demequina litorisediminis TaxID=1849022 RepID=A0ABQ6IFM5_9MICO|nr:hypothetical protein GCM10025876_22940 [Demequina litorisediminis]
MSTDTKATGPIVEDPDVPEYTVYGSDWSEVADEAVRLGQQRIVMNMGPQHPSTHGVLRVMLEIEGETVTEARAGIGYLHTGIEKNMEFRTWTQGVTFCTRMDYVASMTQELAYCLGVEKLLGITDDVPERASVLRVLMAELTRIGSHLVAVGTGGNEPGRDHDHDHGLRGARGDLPRHRGHLGSAHQQRVHPSRWRGPGPARGWRRDDPRDDPQGEGGPRRAWPCSRWRTRSSRAASRTSRP